ncbi:MAG: hypothetical protein AB1531_11410, partial [Chloroflexota bacterium]
MKKDSATRKLIILLFIFIAVGCQPRISTPVEETPSPATVSPAWETATSTATLTSTYSPTPTPYVLKGSFVFSDIGNIYRVDAASGDIHILTTKPG